MPENLVLEKKIEFDLTFAPDDIRKQYEKFLLEGYRSKKTTTQTNKTESSKNGKLSLKIKLIWVAVGIFSFYLFYSKYTDYLQDKERSELQEKEKLKRAEEDKIKNEQEKQDLEAQKNINNARVAINSADLNGVKSNQDSSALLKDAETYISKADEALKKKNYNDANANAKEAIEKANNSIVLFDEFTSKSKSKNKENAKSQKEIKKESSKKKVEDNSIVEDKIKEEKSKVEEKKSEAKSETKKEKKEKEIKPESKAENVQVKEQQTKEKEEKKSEALKNKVSELINTIKKEKSDEEKINLVKKHFSDKLTKIEGDITNIQSDFDNNKYEEASKLAEKVLKELKVLKSDAINEEANAEERRKDALQKILETQKALKQKRLDKGKD